MYFDGVCSSGKVWFLNATKMNTNSIQHKQYVMESFVTQGVDLIQNYQIVSLLSLP